MATEDEARSETERPVLRVVVTPGCTVCASESRSKIDEWIEQGLTWKMITKRLPEGIDLTATDLKDHYEAGHLPVLMSAAVDSGVTAAAPDVRTAVPVSDARRLARAVIAAVIPRVESGEEVPNVREALSAAVFIGDESPDHNDEKDACLQAFLIQQEVFKSLVPPETYTRYLQACSKNETFARLTREAEERRASEFTRRAKGQ